MPGAPRATASPSTRSPGCSSSRATRRRRIPPSVPWRPTPSSSSASGMFEDSFRGIADLVLPGTSYLERDGTTVNLEGRLQRQRRAVVAPVPDVTMWIAKLAERFERRGLAARVRRSSTRSRRSASAGSRSPTSASGRSCRRGRSRRPRAGVRPPAVSAPQGCGSSRTDRCSAAPRSSARPSSSSSGRTPRSSSRARTRRRAGSATARRSPSRRTARRSSCARASRATSQAGVVRVPRDHAGDLHATVEVKP